MVMKTTKTMIRWIESGVGGKSLRDTLRLYVFDLAFLGVFLGVVGLSRGESAAMLGVPIAAVSLVVSQRFIGFFIFGQPVWFRAREVVVFYLDYIPDRLLELLSTGAAVGIGCRVSSRGVGRNFALLLPTSQTAFAPDGEAQEEAVQRLLAKVSERASVVCAALASAFFSLSGLLAYLLMEPAFLEVTDPSFHVVLAALVFTAYVTLHLVYATVVIRIGRRRIRAGDCRLHHYRPGMGQAA